MTEPWGVSARAAALHRGSLVGAAGGGSAYGPGGARGGPRRGGGWGIDSLSVTVGFDVPPWTLAVEAVPRYRHWIRAHDDAFVQVTGVEDVQRARGEGKLA